MSVSQKKDIKIEFKISNIELIEKHFHIPVSQDNKLPNIQFNLAINVSIDKEHKKVVNVLFVKMNFENETSIIASLAVACEFDIINFDELIINKGDSVTMPDAIVETLNIITIGTARGIMFSEFKGTWLHNTILPVIDPKSFKIGNRE